VRADLLQQHGHLDHPQAEAAGVLRDGDAGPSLVDHRLPQLGVVPAPGIDDGAHRRGRRLGVEQLSSCAPERELVV
jgi:hypothetical protein